MSANSAYSTAQFAEFYPQYSAKAAEFVPRTQAPAFNPYAMDQYGAYDMTQLQVQQQCSPYPTGSCCMVDLDDYSDYSDDDSQPDEPTTKATLAMPVDEVRATPTSTLPIKAKSADSPSASTCDETLSDSYCLDSDTSDKESCLDEECAVSSRPNVAPIGNTNAERLTIATMMNFRSTVNWVEGIEEDVLGATEVEGQGFDLAQHLIDVAPVADLRRPARGSGARKGQGKGKPYQKKGPGSDNDKWETARPSAEDCKLASSEGSWLEKQRTRRATLDGKEAETKSNEEVVRSMKSILNKLTIEKFNPLYEKLVSCGIQTKVHLEILINELFEKATTQHHFINMYADLCARLHTHFIDHPITDDPNTSFKKILLNGCQSFFEKNLKPPSNLEKFDEDEQVALNSKFKMQMLGNIKFVGALLVRQMLAAKVLFAISEELLVEPTPESLESLAALLTVVGPKFDVPAWSAHAMLAAVFAQLEGMAKQEDMNCRVRCLLKDLLELRAASWHDKKPKKIEGPSTLKQVADIQAAEETAVVANSSPNWRGQKKPSHSYNGKADWSGAKPVAKKVTSLSGLFNRDAASPKASAPKEEYQRISSLASLKRKTGEPKENEVKLSDIGKWCDADFDKEACHAELLGALTELRVSCEVKEAILRISALSVPESLQADELCNMLGRMVEEGSAAVRKVYFELVAGLFTEGHWEATALVQGLTDFAENVCPDLKCDIPMLPTILREELHAALAAVVGKGMLQPSQLENILAER